MKTVVCDICGKTQEQLIRQGAYIDRYTKTNKVRWWHSENVVEDEFDVCNLCLQAIHDARQKGGAE